MTVEPIRPVLPRRLTAAALLLTVLAPGLAYAHAILEDSEPPQDGTVPPGVVELHLRFNSRIDTSRSRLTLIRPDRTQARIDIMPGGPPDMINARARLDPGAVTIRWQVLAIDGHITRGDIQLTVSEH